MENFTLKFLHDRTPCILTTAHALLFTLPVYVYLKCEELHMRCGDYNQACTSGSTIINYII